MIYKFFELYNSFAKFLPFVFFILLGIIVLLNMFYAKFTNNYNEKIFEIGGKIGRKKFILNFFILTLILIIVDSLSLFKIGIINLIIIIPEFILLFYSWNNICKRLYAITDNIKFSLIFGVFFGLFATIWMILKQKDLIGFRNCYFAIDAIRIIIWVLLMSLPDKKTNTQ